jgi:septum formation protein
MGKDQSLNTPYPLILASTSKYRGALLSQLGWPFEAMNPEIDEDQFKTEGLSPHDLAMTLSRHKAQAVFARYPHACVIGSDQVCTLEGKIFGKPITLEKAAQQIATLQGRGHELLTAVTVLSPQGEESFINRATLHMRSLSLEEIERYVRGDLPLDCAGSYKLESRGIRLFNAIDMSDHTAIIGLPLMELTSVLLKLGYSL